MKFLFETTKKKKKSVHTIWAKLAADRRVLTWPGKGKYLAPCQRAAAHWPVTSGQANAKLNTFWPCAEIKHEAVMKDAN